MRRTLVLISLYSILSWSACAQSDSNLIWITTSADYNYNPLTKSRLELTNHFNFTDDVQKLQAAYLTAIQEFYPIPLIDIRLELKNAWTQQSMESNTYEFRPTVGVQLNIVDRKTNLALLNRLEYRNIKYLEGDSTSTAGRMRLRLDLGFAVNNPTVHLPKTLYLKLDTELFFDLGGGISELFSNRRRLRFGVGWKFSRQHKMEILGMRQGSRNTLEGDFETSQNAFILRYRYTVPSWKGQESSVESNQ